MRFNPEQRRSNAGELYAYLTAPVSSAPNARLSCTLQTEKDVLVDIGCGDGELLLRAAAASGCTVYGYDISETLIRRGRAAGRVCCSQDHSADAPPCHHCENRLDWTSHGPRPATVDPCRTATAKASARNLSSRAHFACASFLDPAFSLPRETTAVFLYLLDHALEHLRGLLQARAAGKAPRP